MCDQHEQMYRDAMTKPMPGIDRPARADDDWKPSLQDHIRLSCIAMRHAEQMEKSPDPWPDITRPWDHRYTPGQLKQVMWVRKMTSPGSGAQKSTHQ